MVSLLFVGSTIEVLGEVLVGLSVYFVHRMVAKEKKIDRHIIAEFHREKVLALTGTSFILIGYILQNI